MTEREFHDGVLQGGPMPIAMVRARLAKTPLTRAGAAPWRFAEHCRRPFRIRASNRFEYFISTIPWQSIAGDF